MVLKHNHSKFITQKERLVNLLVFLIKNQGRKCPPKTLLPIQEKKLLKTAKQNKAIAFVYHFINCPQCKKKLNQKTIQYLSDYQRFTTIWPYLYKREKMALSKFSQKKKVKIVLIKDFSSFSKMSPYSKFQVGADIDLLVFKKDLAKIEAFLFENGYKLQHKLELKDTQKRVYYQEIAFLNSKKQVSLDIHTQLAIPHNDEFHFLERKTIKLISKDVLKNSSLFKKDTLYQTPIEYFLLSLIIHFLGSDLVKGLRNLFDIIKFANLYDKQINWNKFISLSKKYQIKNFSYFILLLGSHIFDLPFPKTLSKKTKIPKVVYFLIPYWSPLKIAIFPYRHKWHPKNEKAQKMFYENFFLKLFLTENKHWSKILKPPSLLFLIKVAFVWIINEVTHPLYHKSLLRRDTQRQQ